MIGNDIVDLKLARNENKSGNTRYLEKVFSAEEIDKILSSKDPETILWRLWSMKETAYKAHQRNFGFKKILNPIKFKCDLDSGIVEIDSCKYLVETTVTSKYIHSFISSETNKIRILENKKDLKLDILNNLSEANHLNIQEIVYLKNANKLPVYRLRSSKTELPLSLSHHGNFAALVFPLINS